jgi:hypothetical protein
MKTPCFGPYLEGRFTALLSLIVALLPQLSLLLSASNLVFCRSVPPLQERRRLQLLKKAPRPPDLKLWSAVSSF